MNISKLKPLAITVFICIILLIILGIAFYQYGQEAGLRECEEQKVETKQETIEVIKYIYKDEVQVYLKPNSTLDELIKRMERGEI